MPAIPPFVLKKLYVKGSLRNEDDGFALDLKNLIAPGTITALPGLDVDGQAIDVAQVTLVPPSGNPRSMGEISAQAPLLFPVGVAVTLRVAGKALEPGPHELTIHVVVQEVGPLDIPVSDTLA
jgi:hydroxymethylglutaryl-CoA reductase (NADPH)